MGGAASKAPARKTTPCRPRTQVERLESIELRISDLPVEALIDLRDGLEELLTADAVDEQAVRRLLDTVEV